MLNEVSGFNASRRIFEEGTDIAEEIDGARASLPLPVFQVAVVVDVFSNPSQMTKETLQKLKEGSATPELYERMPRNSIAGRIITRNQDLYDSSPKVFFPVNIFDSEPVKPGEQVFIFYVDQTTNDQIGYWWKRVPQPIDTDDINFTHADRKYQANEGSSSTDKLAGVQLEAPGFKNGGESTEQQTLSNPKAYDEINKNATANAQIIKEPVARFTKRPGDKIIQGSNAARIVLGMDRKGPASESPRKKSATIDIVVGYGREDTPTAPKTVENSRGEIEVDKRPTTKPNDTEGDPDFENDPSRIYVSEDTNIDENFAVEISGIPASEGTSASIGIKSERIRILANGDIKIVGNDNAVVLDTNGDIHLVSSGRVNLGSASPSLGVARLNDTVGADTTFMAWMIQVQAIVSAAGALVGISPPVFPSDFGIITKASQKTYSE